MEQGRRPRSLVGGLPAELYSAGRKRPREDVSEGVAAFPPLTEGKLYKFSHKPWSGRVDTLGISVPVGPDFEVKGGSVMIANFGTVEEMITVRHALPRGGFVALGKGGRAWIELSAKAVGDGSNVEALRVPVAVESLRLAVLEAGRFCEVDKGHLFEDSEVVRLDGVRDFEDVEHIPELIEGLRRVPSVDARHKRAVIASGDHNGAQTLRVGPKSWNGLMYDKFEESRRPEARGRLRFEARLHKDQLTSRWSQKVAGHVRVVADLSSEKVELLSRSVFARCGFDREVLPAQAVASRVFESDLSERERAALWAYLTLPDAQSRMHRHTQRKYRKVAAALGVAPVDVLSGESLAVRLDYDSGREVLYAA